MQHQFKQNPSQVNKPDRKWTSSYVATVAATVFGLFLLANGILLFRSITQVRDHAQRVAHSYRVLTRAETILALFKDLHVGSQGYLLTGKTEYLAPLDSAAAKIFGEIDELIKNLADTKDQQSRVVQFRELVDQFMVVHREIVDIRNKRGVSESVQAFSGGRSRALFNMMQRLVTDFSEEEKRILKLRGDALVQSEDSMSRSLLFTTVGNFVLVILTGWFMRRYLRKQDEDTWVSSGYAVIADTIRDQQTEDELCETIIAQLASMSDAAVANIYAVRGKSLRRAGSFGGVLQTLDEIRVGEGLLGESARHLKVIQMDGLPSSHLSVQSSLGTSRSCSILVFPVIVHGQLIAVIELGGFKPFSKKHLRLLRETSESIGAAIESAAQRARLSALLTAMEVQTAELASKEEVLRESNKELEQQASVLETQKEVLGDRNRELELVRSELEQRALDLEKAGKYKSEFLANMSHELRTPLNSLLILASLLLENKDKRLGDKELDFLKTIHRSGNDLLVLINDILDLSKVAAGKLEIHVEKISMQSLADSVAQGFRALAEAKNLQFSVDISGDCPGFIDSDVQRVEQILRNFLSNAIKFTNSGLIKVSFAEALDGGVRITVSDTGIGIPSDKLDVIFQAFQQGDGSTSRRFGGTGLGLTISRDLAALLGGSIQVVSEEDGGSQFTLTLPRVLSLAVRDVPISMAAQSERPYLTSKEPVYESFGDRLQDARHMPAVLIVDGDERFATQVLDAAQILGFRARACSDVEEATGILKREAINGIILDLKLGSHGGLTLLNHLKASAELSRIPLHMISRMDVAEEAEKNGMISYLVKPVVKEKLKTLFREVQERRQDRISSVLVIEDDNIQRGDICRSLRGCGYLVDTAVNGVLALEKLASGRYDCMVLDLILPDMSGFDILRLLGDMDLPTYPHLVIYSAKDLSPLEQEDIARASGQFMPKTEESSRRMLAEVHQFLRNLRGSLHGSLEVLTSQTFTARISELRDEKVLIVDDDMRNIYALMNALQSQGIAVLTAKNGLEAVEILERSSDVGLVIMDIFMPVMDGYEAIRRIRDNNRTASVPIIALTSKSQRDDFQKCLDAGANDYLSKPVDLAALMSQMKFWLSKDSDFMRPS